MFAGLASPLLVRLDGESFPVVAQPPKPEVWRCIWYGGTAICGGPDVMAAIGGGFTALTKFDMLLAEGQRSHDRFIP